MTFSKQLAVLALVSLTSACTSEPASPPAENSAANAPASGTPAASTPPGAASDALGPRVFFVEPQDGATVKSPARLRFGIANYEISPVPQGTVETPRPGVGHHHVAVDTECLPPGTEIVKGAAWVHFGDGKNEIEMQLPPGSHRLTLQLGDDQHRTKEGLCSTITVNVAQ
jgi:hypothetical protein